MMEILRFRSLWGVDPGAGLENWKSFFPELQKQGYHGIEVDIIGLDPHTDLPKLRDLCKSFSLKASVTIFSSWPQYSGPRPSGLKPIHHLKSYREQLQLAKVIEPVVINAQSGADHWSWEESVEFYRGTLEIDAELGLTGVVCQETHRNRSLFNPYVTDYILQQIPELRLTADLSHWVLVCERLLDVAEEDVEILNRVLPKVHHIHTRIGTTQSSQCADSTANIYAAERKFFENIWLRIIELRYNSGDSKGWLSFVPEYGPFPYHPHGSIKTNGHIADEEGSRLQKVFENHIAKLS